MQPISSEHTHRPISYKELAMLDVMFRRRIITQRVIFASMTQRELALLDYIEQYYEGVDYPVINLDAI